MAGHPQQHHVPLAEDNNHKNQPNPEVSFETIMKDPSERLKVSIFCVAFAFLIIGLSLVEHQFPLNEDKDLPLWTYPLALITAGVGIIAIVNWLYKPPSERVQLPNSRTSFWLIIAIIVGSSSFNSWLLPVLYSRGIPAWTIFIIFIGGYLGIAGVVEVFYTRITKDTNSSLDMMPPEAQNIRDKNPSEKRIVSIVYVISAFIIIGLSLVDHQFGTLEDVQFSSNANKDLPFWAYPLVLIAVGVGIIVTVNEHYKPTSEQVQIFLRGRILSVKSAIELIILFSIFISMQILIQILLDHGIPLWAAFITGIGAYLGAYFGINTLLQMFYARRVKSRHSSLDIPPPPPPPEAGTFARTGLDELEGTTEDNFTDSRN